MKREAILKILLVLIVGVMLLAKPVDVFATSSNPTDLNDFWEDQGSLEDIQGTTPTTPTTPEPSTPSTQTKPETTPSTSTKPETTKPTTQTKPNNTNTDKELPKAGLVEDTMIIVSILAFIAVAVFTFVKISDYSNI